MKEDFTRHSPAAGARTPRSTTTAVVLHRFAADPNGDGRTTFEEAIRFFTQDPEGLATVALAGTYAEKVPTIERWRADGVPEDVRARGFVPYHFLIDRDGRIARMLPLEARGAHAGVWNWRSVGVACLGNFDKEAPSLIQREACAEVVANILAVWPGAEVLSHDEALARVDQPTKGCAGRFFPLELMPGRKRRP